MTEAAAPKPPEHPAPGSVADVMHPPVTTVEQGDHVAAAAYLMKHASATALMVVDPQTSEPVGIITEADIARVVADGKNVNDVRVHDLMTSKPTTISAAASIRIAARIMTDGHFRHLPVVGDTGLIGMVDITDVCRALLGPDGD
ncbi:MAG TPA: CBS domain-containing protein [Streptosporangiaceae bacterium]|nr:CBS domain-containing protein [Streptosporangiaceae bacterium]